MAASKPSNSQRLSRLESLPVELIQHIFFSSFEVNMPRASTHLARVLSKPSIYKALVLFAYFDNLDDQLPIETHHFRPAEYRRLSRDEQIRLQRGILGCRWLTPSLLKSCMPTLSRLQMTQAWHHEHQAEKALGIGSRELELSPLVPPELVTPAVRVLLQRVAVLPALDDDLGMRMHFFAMQPLVTLKLPSPVHLGLAQRPDDQGPQLQLPILGPTGDEDTLPRILQWYSWLNRTNDFYKTVRRGSSTSILAARVLPDHIVRGGPWTESKLELLQLLRQGVRFLFVDRVLEISAAALFEGMASAIREENDQALLVLLELHYATMRLHPRHEPNHLDGTPLRGRRYLVAPFAHPLPIELFHLAVKRNSTAQQILAPIDPDAGGETESQREARPQPQSQVTTPGEADHEPDTPLHLDSQPNEDGAGPLRTPRPSTARILTLLLREGVDSVGLDDSILTRWATHTWTHTTRSSDLQDRRLARWLLDYMSGTDDYGLARGEPLFVNGEFVSPRREDECPFPQKSFSDEIGYVVDGEPEAAVRAPDGGPCG
ncbi:hypothetical protein A1O3_10195 [Capronia epimyces CBS 606.96]|uniref:Uncharacterized protein n=1 Tax=Capronia epimyces CBS 606.96 TaxID=1182542 RepID=W9X996_9EURO|nr:uncharacterized protein A1O3_10195 [Capronia epimyces CBS 606.96]EXJ77037.1 hypothetical protein A1O3_10195 [Capronia epimyces CBS 606.96]